MSSERPASPNAEAAGKSPRRQAARTCGWCGDAIEVKPRGRIPTWCSPACRQRAWEQSRAAESGRSAVQVVERLVEVQVERDRVPRHGEWAGLLRQLSEQLDTGRIYPRDLPALHTALTAVLDAYARLPTSHARYRSPRA